jgi:hypothetical protein
VLAADVVAAAEAVDEPGATVVAAAVDDAVEAVVVATGGVAEDVCWAVVVTGAAEVDAAVVEAPVVVTGSTIGICGVCDNAASGYNHTWYMVPVKTPDVAPVLQ